MSYKGKINRYTCRVCGKAIITVDRDEGATPMMLNCRATDGCQGIMMSSMYLIGQSLKPDFEWYKPTGKVKKKYRQHVKMGGLLIRRIGK